MVWMMARRMVVGPCHIMKGPDLQVLPFLWSHLHVLLAGAGEVINVRPGVFHNKMCVLWGRETGTGKWEQVFRG